VVPLGVRLRSPPRFRHAVASALAASRHAAQPFPHAVAALLGATARLTEQQGPSSPSRPPNRSPARFSSSRACLCYALLRRCEQDTPLHVVFVGLDGAGKSTLLAWWQTGTPLHVAPTWGTTCVTIVTPTPSADDVRLPAHDASGGMDSNAGNDEAGGTQREAGDASTYAKGVAVVSVAHDAVTSGLPPASHDGLCQGGGASLAVCPQRARTYAPSRRRWLVWDTSGHPKMHRLWAERLISSPSSQPRSRRVGSDSDGAEAVVLVVDGTAPERWEEVGVFPCFAIDRKTGGKMDTQWNRRA